MGVVAGLDAIWLIMEPRVERSCWSLGDWGACSLFLVPLEGPCVMYLLAGCLRRRGVSKIKLSHCIITPQSLIT